MITRIIWMALILAVIAGIGLNIDGETAAERFAGFSLSVTSFAGIIFMVMA